MKIYLDFYEDDRTKNIKKLVQRCWLIIVITVMIIRDVCAYEKDVILLNCSVISDNNAKSAAIFFQKLYPLKFFCGFSKGFGNCSGSLSKIRIPNAALRHVACALARLSDAGNRVSEIKAHDCE